MGIFRKELIMLDDATDTFTQNPIADHLLYKFFFSEIEADCSNFLLKFLKEWPDIDNAQHPLVQQMREIAFGISEMLKFTRNELERGKNE